ncbi:putative metallopeptidase [Candidatus Hecatella orcuttiae]|jgi:predicted metallopeptidase|uniref:putative metallopeptidase n=1 Tax=Candidatus Hecatella orcuttiae TaxID=1935119 RepID=UPI002867E7DC|nr:putative metallopeptidase [Candidatus Hecatella orcuttiae]
MLPEQRIKVMGSIKYYAAPDVRELFENIVTKLGFSHVDCGKISFFRSQGSKSRYTVARVYGLPRIWQQALGLEPHYVLEVISERYDRLTEEEKEKTLIHEALHIPRGFQGGFRHHKGNIDKRKIDRLHKAYRKCFAASASQSISVTKH